MKGFPKVIKTKSDLVNTFKMAKKGGLKKQDWLEAVAKLENQNWIMCPVINLSEDRKAVTIMFCAEAAAGQRVKNGAVYPTIQDIEMKSSANTENTATEEQETTREGMGSGQEAAGQNATIHTILNLSKAVNIGTTEIGIPATVTFYDRLGISKEEVEEMKGELEA